MDIIIQIVSLDIYNNSWFSPYEKPFFQLRRNQICLIQMIIVINLINLVLFIILKLMIISN